MAALPLSRKRRGGKELPDEKLQIKFVQGSFSPTIKPFYGLVIKMA